MVWAGAILTVDGPCLEGDGWLNTLPFWLPRLLLLASKMHAKMRPASNRAPTTLPITIPAMAPPDSPLDAAAVFDGVGVAVAVGGAKVMVGKMEGSVTPAQRWSMFAL